MRCPGKTGFSILNYIIYLVITTKKSRSLCAFCAQCSYAFYITGNICWEIYYSFLILARFPRTAPVLVLFLLSGHKKLVLRRNTLKPDVSNTTCEATISDSQYQMQLLQMIHILLYFLVCIHMNPSFYHSVVTSIEESGTVYKDSGASARE
ncbi:hypothetical protein CEXT_416151 [Caerostris extrusa]|uniref:Uncharacterized protein n=1 Tax=Caerostris extrusa TaxID=172846 RepID=A0AAV4N1V8_CAEEX|nr:hypothetical protein CEXT_416151 [Caerostris extrusa]